MNLMAPFAQFPLTVLIGWALIHFLWQGSLLAVVLALLLKGLKKSPAGLRYACACGVLLAMSLCPIFTTLALQQYQPSSAGVRPSRPSLYGSVARLYISPGPEFSSAPINAASIATVSDAAPAPAGHLSTFPVYVFLLWTTGVTLLSIRMFGGWVLVRRLVRHSTRPVSGPLLAAFAQLASRMGIERLPRLLACDGVVAPTMVGGMRSAILLPAAALTGLSTEMLHSILTHELAHVKRHDYLVNLWQSAVETVLFYHPAVWWVSSVVRVEREHACDDMVVSLLDDRATYAGALASLEETRHRLLALSASDGPLLARIRRILAPGPGTGGKRPSALASVALAASLAFALVGTGSGIYSTAAAARTAHGSDVARYRELARLPGGEGSGHLDPTLAASRPFEAARPTAPVGAYVTLPHGLLKPFGLADSWLTEGIEGAASSAARSGIDLSWQAIGTPGSGIGPPAAAPAGIALPGTPESAPPLAIGVDNDGPRMGQGPSGLTAVRSIEFSDGPVLDARSSALRRAGADDLAMHPSSLSTAPTPPSSTPDAVAGKSTGQEHREGNGVAGAAPSTIRTVQETTKSATGPTIGEFITVGNKNLNGQAIITLAGGVGVEAVRIGSPCTSANLEKLRDNLARSGFFGMHHPDRKDEWVKVQADDIGNNRCKVTITVDENDRITGISITGSGPIKIEEVKALITPSPVYNIEHTARDAASIIELYNRRGYSIEFGQDLGMEPKDPGVLTIPIIVSRVGAIVIHLDDGLSTDQRLLRPIMTRSGDYFNRKVFYESDRKKLMDTRRYADVTFSERRDGDKVNLEIDLLTKAYKKRRDREEARKARPKPN